jgi:ATP-dependent RNA helicase SUPV3L1/SUV3
LARVEERLKAWASAHLARLLEPLAPLQAIGSGEAVASGPVRAIAFRLYEEGGTLPRASVSEHLKALSKADRQQFKALGVRLGPQDIFLPRMQKPAPSRLKTLLWRVSTGGEAPDVAAGRVSLKAEETFSEAAWRWAGYRLIAGWAIRIDALDRFITGLIRREQDGFIAAGPDLAATLGLTSAAFADVMTSLGYRTAEREVTGFERAPKKQRPSSPGNRPKRRAKGKPKGEAEKRPRYENRPLAALAELQKEAREGKGE